MSLSEEASQRARDLFDALEIPNSAQPDIVFRQLEPGIAGICRESDNVLEIDIWQVADDIVHFDSILLHEFAHSLLPRGVYHAWPFLAVQALVWNHYWQARGVDEPESYFDRAVHYDMQWWWAAPASMRLKHIEKARRHAERLSDRPLVDAARVIAKKVPALHFWRLWTNRRPRAMLWQVGVGGLLLWWFVVAGGWRQYGWIFN